MSSEPPHPSFLSNMLESNKYCDLTLVCQGQKFPVHKMVVCAQSPVLAAACDGNFQEATNSTIQVTNFSPETVESMVRFMYKGTYLEPEPDLEDDDDDMLELPTMIDVVLPHVLVNPIADYYNIPALVKQSNSIIYEWIGDQGIGKHVSLEGFEEVIKVATESSSDEGLHSMLATTTAAHGHELIDDKDFKNLALINSFSLGVIRQIYENHSEELKAMEYELRIYSGKVIRLESQLETSRRIQKLEKTQATREISKLQRVVQLSLEFSKDGAVCAKCMEKLHSNLKDNKATRLYRCANCRR